jgi:hypothetical protein
MFPDQNYCILNQILGFMNPHGTRTRGLIMLSQSKASVTRALWRMKSYIRREFSPFFPLQFSLPYVTLELPTSNF